MTAAGWAPRLSSAGLLRRDQARGEDQLLLPERLVRLSPSAASVLHLCDGERTVADIADTLAAHHPGAPVARDVAEFLDEARGRGWVE